MCLGEVATEVDVRGNVLSLSSQGCSYQSVTKTLGVRPRAVELDGLFPWPLLLDPIIASL